jgi:hypothetical protein
LSKKLEGGCFCGAVRYRLLETPMFVQCCHCTECQNQTGSAFVVNALIETKNLKKLKGTLECIAMSPKNDSPHDVYRCRKCKVAVWSDYGRRPQLRFLRVGTLDQPKAFPPAAHIFTRSKLPWVKLSKNTPAFTIYYDMQKLWPAKSLKRREKILGN